MKSRKLLIAILSILLIYACSKDSSISEYGTDENITNRDSRDCEIDRALLSDEDQLKFLLSKFVNEALQHTELKTYFLNHLYTDDRDGDDIQNPEFLIAKHLSDEVNVGTSSRFGTGQGPLSTLEDIMTNWVSINDPDQLELFQSLCQDYSDFVLQFPWWSVDIIEDAGGVQNAEFGTIGAIEPQECDGKFIRTFFHGGEAEIIDVKKALRKYIPIYVKEAEHHIKVKNTPEETLEEIMNDLMIFYEDCTFTAHDLVTFIETVDCSDLQYADYSKMAVFFKKNCSGARSHETDCCDGEDNDGDGLIDCEDVDDCPCEVEICNDGCDNDNDGHIDDDDEDCQCDAQYQRDCQAENNVLVGLKFGEAAWLNVCQLKEEADITLQMKIDAVELCDAPLNQCAIDPLADFNIQGLINQFFEIQKIHPGHIYYDPLADLYEDNILWMSEDGKKYWKVFPLYVALRKKYLESKMNQWIPSDIGSTIGISVYEEDNTTATTSQTETNSITSRHSVNAGATIGLSELISTNFSYTFDQTKVSSATSVINMSYEKDVFINNYTLHYWDKDEEIPDPTGVEGNTWYGQIPGNSGTGLDALYLEFRIHG